MFGFQSTFQECLVDARMLEHISKKEHQKYLKLVDGFHRFVLTAASIFKVNCALGKHSVLCVSKPKLKPYMYIVVS